MFCCFCSGFDVMAIDMVARGLCLINSFALDCFLFLTKLDLSEQRLKVP